MFVGIDIGTSSLKLMVINKEGHIIYTDKKAYPLFVYELNSEQNPIDWKKAVLESLSAIPDTIKEQIVSIGLSGQMHGMVLLDQKHDVIRPAILWNDQRTFKEVEYLNDIIGKERLIEYTSNFALTGYTAPKVLWMYKNEKSNFDKIYKILLPKDYIAFVLTNQFVTDYSDASGTLYFDVRHKVWSDEMLEILHLRKDQLPNLHESMDVIGTITEEISRITGFPKDVKVSIGGGDQAVGALGSFVMKEGEVNIALGTSGVVYYQLNDYREDVSKSLHVFCNAIGGYHFMGVMLTCAEALKWWSTIQQQDVVKLVYEIKKLDTDIVFLPYLQGERTPINDAFATGMFYGLTLSHMRSDMTLAVMEGVAFGIKDILETMIKAGVDIKEAYVNGGAANSELWMQILADTLGITLHLTDTVDAVAYGAALIALASTYSKTHVEQLATQKNIIKSIIPNKAREAYYQSKFIKYKQLYKKNR